MLSRAGARVGAISGELRQSVTSKTVLVLVEFHVTPLYVGPRLELKTHTHTSPVATAFATTSHEPRTT